MAKTDSRPVGKWDRNASAQPSRRTGVQPLLRVEPLEERLALATFLVAPTPDVLVPGSLRDAIIQANSTPEADRIVMSAGTYSLTLAGAGENAGATGDLDVLGELTIQGADDATSIIDASALGDRAIEVLGANVKMQDVVIQGGTADQGGAIRVEDGSLIMLRCRLYDNTAQGVDAGDGLGGAIYQSGGTITLDKCTFSGNQAIGADANAADTDGGDGRGGAIYILNSKGGLSGSLFQDNRATGGGNVVSHGRNSGFGAGGAVSMETSTLQISKSRFLRNQATGGAGSDQQVAIAGGQGYGGAMEIKYQSSVSLDGCTIKGNTARGGTGGDGWQGGEGGTGDGGGIFVGFISDLTLTKCTVTGNQAIGGHGGYAEATPFAENAGTQTGGDGVGGVVYGVTGVTVDIAKSAFRDNKAVGGEGGDGPRAGNGGMGSGGVIWSASNDQAPAALTFADCILQANQALGGNGGTGEGPLFNGGAGPAAGGAIALGTNVETKITRSRLQSNIARGGAASGGAIQTLDTTLTIANSTVSGNQSLGGVGSYGAGGAMCISQTKLTIEDTQINRNIARGGRGITGGGAGQGGAIYTDALTRASLRGATFQGNQAIGGPGNKGFNGGLAWGGAIASYGGWSLDILECNFKQNLALGGPAGAGGQQGEGSGGAIYCDTSGLLTMKASVVTLNRAVGAPGSGGGIYFKGKGSATTTDSVLSKNFASTDGDDIFGPVSTDTLAKPKGPKRR